MNRMPPSHARPTRPRPDRGRARPTGPPRTRWFAMAAAAAFLAVVSVAILAPAPAWADGGTIRLADLVFGEYRVTVFTDPTPVTPDSLDVSFLITGERGLAVATDVRAWVEVTPLDHDGTPARHEATREQADDPRFYAAKFRLGTEGRWRVDVEVSGPRGEGTAFFELTARRPGLLNQPLVLLVAGLLPLLLVGAWLALGDSENEEDGEGAPGSGADGADSGEVGGAGPEAQPSA